ncbi:MAG: hypothetical protein A3E31_16285, partial [Candidatus Rokubacteria bacterium RIFCSPHIGHO2_12_FULL_73_22]
MVTVLAANGAVTVSGITARGGVGGTGTGADGTVQLSGSSTIGQQGGTAIGAGSLKVIATGGAVTLANAGNDVAVLAVDLSGASSLTYADASALAIGTVAQAGTGAGQLAQTVGAVAAGNGQPISVTAHTQNLTVADVVTTLAGDVTLSVAAGALALQAAVTTRGGKATLTAASGITSTAGGTVATTGMNGDPGTAGGEVFLLTTGPGAIDLEGGITATGGSGTAAGQSGGNGGVVSVFADAGAITLGDVSSLGGASGGGAGAAGLDGTVQLAGTGISQRGGTRLRAGGLKVFGLGGVPVTLANATNDVATLAASLSASGLSYADANAVTVGVVADAGTGDANLSQQSGVAVGGAGQPVTVVAATDLTVAAAIGTNGGALTLTATAGTLAFTASVETAGGALTATAATAITSAPGSVLDADGVSGAPGTAGGEVLLRATAGSITLQEAITASGGDGDEPNAASGAGGVVTLLAGAGTLMVGNVTTRGGAPGNGGDAGDDGIVQLSATGTIGQQAGSAIQAWHLKVLDTGGAVTLTNAGNDVDVLAARLSNASGLSYTDADGLTVGRVDAAGTGAANLGLVDGVTISGGQPLGLVSVDGTLNVLKPVEVTGAATILLHAQGQGTNILIDATVTAGSGNITLRASGFVILSAPDLVTTDGQVIVDSQGQLAPGIEVVFTGQDEWTGQGPTDVTGGQLEGMDAQGNPIAAAISAILVDPVNPSIVYIGAVNGGIWRTFDINRTIQVEPFDRFKPAAPVVTSAFPFAASLIGADGAIAAGGPHLDVTAGGGNAARSVGDVGSIRFTATATGSEFDGLSVVYADTAVAGAESADYDGAAKRLTVSLQDNVSTARQVIDAINRRLGVVAEAAATLPFTAALTDGAGGTAVNAGTPAAGATVVGDATTPASATFGNIRFTARENGAQFNGLQVVYAGILGAGGVPTAQYDPATKRLSVYIPAGGSTAQAVVDAVGAAGALTGGGSYAYRIVFEDGAGAHSNASEPIVVPALAETDRLVTLRNLPVGPDGTVKRVIYRTAAGGTLFRLVGGIPDNAPGRLFTDRTADAGLGDEREIEVPFPLWQPLTDSLPSLAISVLAFDPNDATYRTIYAGTGNTSSSNEAGQQIGVLRTTNGGDSWEILSDQIAGLKVTDVIPVRAGAFMATLLDPAGAATTVSATTLATVFGGGAAGVRATARWSPVGNANDLVFTAADPGADMNGVSVVFENTVAVAGNETAAWNAGARRLTVQMKAGVGGSTPGQIIAALPPAGAPLTAAIAASPSVGHFELGSVAARTTGGRAAVEATAAITPTAGDGNDLRFIAREGGVAGNGITIVLEDGLAAGATATYDAFAKRLTIRIKAGPGGTTPAQVIAAVADEITRNPRTAVRAELTGNANLGHFAAVTKITGGGVDARPAGVVFDAGVATQAIRFDAVRGGVEFDGTHIRFVDGAVAGQETAAYDAANHRFEIRIQSGVTTAQQVVDALARAILVATASPEFQTAPVTRPVGLFRSLDGGRTFQLMSNNFTAGNQLRGGGVTDLIEVPAPLAGNDDRVVLFAGVVSSDAADSGIWRSEDRGRSWVRVDVPAQPFTATIVIVAGSHAGVTAGGSPTAASTGVLGSIRFTATSNGVAGDGLTVTYVAGVGVTAGNERIGYDAANDELTVAVEVGRTTPAQVVAAMPTQPPFAAALLDAGTDPVLNVAAATALTMTTAGDANTAAVGTLGALRFTAGRTGAAFNNLRVAYRDDPLLVPGTAFYDPQDNTLYVNITDGVTRASDVVTILAAMATPFTARVVGDDTVVAGTTLDVTAGGGPGISAGTLGSVRFTATQPGTALDGLVVRYVDAVTAGNERASYAPRSGATPPTLTVAIEDNRSTAAGVVAAVTTVRPFTAELVGADAPVAAGPAAGPAPALNVTSLGAPGAPATGVLASVRFTATRNGAAFNGLSVEYQNNADVTGGNETATYDARTNRITVQIRNGVTTAAGVVNAVNAIPGSQFGAALVVGPEDVVVTDGGERGTPYAGTFGAIRFTAARNGADLDTFSVEYVAGVGVTAGNERSVYDATANRLTVAIADNQTTASQLIAALNPQRPFTAAPDGADGTVGVADSGLLVVTTPGGAAAFAVGTRPRVQFTATKFGATFDSLRVTYVAGATAGQETAAYDPATHELTIRIADGVSLASQVIAAVNRMPGLPFTGALAVTDGVANDVTAGGTAGTSAGTLGAVRFTARAGGADFDGLRVTYVAGVTAGNERATYTAPAAGTPASLTIALEPGVSTPTQVAAAVTNLRPFTAAPKAPDATNGVVVDVTAPTEVTKDGRTGVASAGALGAILFTATRTGPQFNNLRVAYVDGAEQGKERATYDPATNTLTVQIAAGVSSADQVIVAVNAMAAPGYTAAAVASTTTVTTGVVAAAAVTPGVGAPAFGLLGAVKFTAVRDGAALDGLRVVYVDATTAGAERASYDPDTKTLRVAIEDGRTTPAQVVAALTAQPAFTATLVPAAPDAPVNVGGPTVVTRGGDLGTAAVGDLAGVRFTATRNGAQFNGLRVEFVGGATRGGERATYDAGTHLLRVTLEDGQSRASDVRAAVNRLAAPTADYTAAVVDLTAALGVGTTPTVTFGGAVAANASGVAGSLRFTARQPGAAFDNLTVTYVGGVTAGNERAHYDPATRVLSVVIEDGRTIPGQVAAAITDQRPFVATLGGPGAAVSAMPAPAALTQVT